MADDAHPEVLVSTAWVVENTNNPVPGAGNIPWAKPGNEDGAFKSRDELDTLYGDAGLALA